MNIININLISLMIWFKVKIRGQKENLSNKRMAYNNKMKILENFLWKGLETEIENDKLGILSDNSCKFIEINLKTFKKKFKDLSIPKTEKYIFDEKICVCLLPGNALFCDGGTKWWGELIGITYLIHENFSIQMLPSGVPQLGCIAAYHDNFVYVFGYISLGRFNLIKQKWGKFVEAPWPGNWCSCISFNDYILASRYDNTEIFVLDLLIFSFSWTSALLEPNKTKIICKSDNVAYIIDFSGKIFESETFNPFEWNVIGNCSSSNYRTYGYKVFYRNCWYFALDSKVLKFNLDKKTIEDTSVSVPHKFREFGKELEEFYYT